MTQTQTTATLTALEYLQSLPQWVVWQYETRNGKKTKIPYNANTGKKARSDNPQTWCSYEQAQKTLATYPNDYAGIGFMFNETITGIDLDHCIDEDGNIDPWAQEIITQFSSYCEKSPSGTGVHIFIHASLINHKGTPARRLTEKSVPFCAILCHFPSAFPRHSLGDHLRMGGNGQPNVRKCPKMSDYSQHPRV